MRAPLILVALLAACGGVTEPVAPQQQVSVQRVHIGKGLDASSWISLYVLATDASGAALGCGESEVALKVSVSFNGGDYVEVPNAELSLDCDERRGGDLALVVDNSGSTASELSLTQQAASSLIDDVLAVEGRASLVRVSTNAEVLVPVSTDREALHAAVDDLFVNHGWSALWDGVRMGNETLAGPAQGEPRAFDSQHDFCEATNQLGVVVFTDGEDNNSSDEQAYDHQTYPGDGIDTALEDLYKLRVRGITTPIYTIGLGDEVDQPTLAALAASTGGRHLQISDPAEIPQVFGLVSDYVSATGRVCAELPEEGCGAASVRVEWSWTEGEERFTQVRTSALQIDCPEEPSGRIATFLMTFSDPGITQDQAATMAGAALDWVSPSPEPAVLVVLDDDHHGESADDAAYIATLLRQGDNRRVDLVDEPAEGIRAADLEPYDAVWFSNPGYPIDDLGSMLSLEAFLAAGGGVVLQGDDASWSWGQSFPMHPLTHLDFADNGTSTCGVHTDNQQGGALQIAFAELDHPIAVAMAGEVLSYGDDMDHTTPRGEGEQVLAWASLRDAPECAAFPAVVSYEP
ncbi:MAG: VWA domain-containing protein [Deltaproteobacteria bacterium]|nr:VWA domain-containing protein [Deltaproteobacteria bacterium]